MKLHVLVSSAALAAALSFSGAAVAQNMLNGVEIPSDQIESFKGKCEALRAADASSLTTGTDVADDPTQTGTVATDSAASTADSSDPAAKANWDEALASLTIEQCDAAGFSAAQ